MQVDCSNWKRKELDGRFYLEVSEDGVSRLLRILTQGKNIRGKARWMSIAQSYKVMHWGRA